MVASQFPLCTYIRKLKTSSPLNHGNGQNWKQNHLVTLYKDNLKEFDPSKKHGHHGVWLMWLLKTLNVFSETTHQNSK